MEQPLFSIACTTCRARLVVRDESAIGEIHECPKCASFVHIVPPVGWEPPGVAAGEPDGQGNAEGVAAGSAAAAASFPDRGESVAEPSVNLVEPPDLPAKTGLVGAKPPPLPASAAASAAATTGSGRWWVSPAEQAWRRWLLWATIPPLGVVLGVAGWSMLARRGRPLPEPPPAESFVAEAGRLPAETPEPPPADVDPVPGETPEPEDSSQPEAAPPDEPGDTEQPRSPGELPADEMPPVEPPGDEHPAEASPPDDPRPDEPPPARPPIAQPGLSEADVHARMAEVIPTIEMNETPLGEALGLLGALSTVPITLDADVLGPMELTPRDPVTVRLSAPTLGRALVAVAGQVGLTPVVERGQVLVTAPAAFRQETRTMRYSVSDLTGDDPTALDELAAMIRQFVAPERWETQGGSGAVRVVGQALEIDQTPVVHYEVIVFCEKLRVARGRSPRSRIDPDRFALATRAQRARAILDHPVTANYRHEAPLVQVLGHLATSAGADILIDRLGLAAAGVADQTPVSVAIEDEPLAAALDKLLRPLGLSYRAIDAETLQVTGRAEVDSRLELEFYPVADRLARGGTVEALIREIKSGAPGASWAESGGRAAILFDPPSGCLIVLQSQPVQTAIERLLREPPG